MVMMDALPTTPSGKIDRRSLPAPEGRRPDLDVTFAPPAGALERDIAVIWQEVLQVSRVGLPDNFFDWGGHSLVKLFRSPSAGFPAQETLQKELEQAQANLKHLIFIVQENRSFDHYFGTFPGAEGIPFKNGKPSVCVPDPAYGTCAPPYPSASLPQQARPPTAPAPRYYCGSFFFFWGGGGGEGGGGGGPGGWRLSLTHPTQINWCC